jgi:hypothetical protein
MFTASVYRQGRFGSRWKKNQIDRPPARCYRPRVDRNLNQLLSDALLLSNAAVGF